MSWKEAFNADVKKYLAERQWNPVTDVAEILRVYDDTESGGYCETCYYEEEVVIVEYINEAGEHLTKTINLSMREFMESL
ncbi:hypothetical protein PBI_GRAYSON_127 [Rhodococcus phage Grayson]|nr:hypothetical protein PBI_GRAYSON_127 [Rhodococcus phage Grayson]